MKWISVKNKYPDVNQACLLFVPKNCFGCSTICIGQLLIDSNKTILWSSLNSVRFITLNDLKLEDVSHWIPLSELPEIEDEVD